MPAMKSLPMDVSVTRPNSTNGTEGGIMIASVPAMAMVPTAKEGAYPAFIMAGKEARARLAAEAACTVPARMQAIAMPPRIRRNRRLQASNKSSATPPAARNSAISTNIGMVRST